MHKVGLVTLHEHNYGSALQCYATRAYLKGKGYNSDVICEAGEYGLLKRYFKRVLELGMLCLSHIRETKDIIKVFKSQRRGALRNSVKTENSISRFNHLHLSCKYYSRKGLEEIAKSDEYQFFLSGSDQVWNGRQIDNVYLHFLRFAPKEKRIAWAPSFGGSTIARYNKKRYSRYITEYNMLSVREKSGIDIINNLTGREDVTFLSDPVMLLDANGWRNCYSNNETVERPEVKYVLAFFLDKASDQAIRAIKKLEEENGLPVYTVGYPHEEFLSQLVDGSPWDFLTMIDGAEYVLTDSFHATVFSIIFHKKFYTFERQYVHGHSQSTRITELLTDCQLQSCFCPLELKDEEIDFSAADAYFVNVRNRFSNYLKNLSNEEETKGSEKNVRDNKCDSCGCGACADICHVKAITMLPDGIGHVYPHIDSALCTNCGACQRVCSFNPIEEEPSFQKKGYVVCGNDTKLIKDSASGGAFAAIAKTVIERRGVVYGASLWMDNGKVECEHIKVDTIEELYRIQGSKYVQSSTQGVFPAIRDLLKADRLVLFGGTSCQVAALKGFLKKDYDNLLTVDLICHGVPSLPLLQDYLDYQNKEFHAEVVDFRFRTREGRDKPYQTTTTTRDSNGLIKQHRVSLRNSAFYRLFMGRGGYRPSCYNCPFASINKPADITVGDYYLSKEETDLQKVFANNEILSTLIVHTDKGQKLIDELSDALISAPISIDKLINKHEQLQSPSQATTDGIVLHSVYKEKGFQEAQKVVNKRNFEMFIPSSIKRIITFIK